MVKRASMVSGFESGKTYRVVAMVVNVSLVLLLPVVLAKNAIYKGYVNENGICISLCTQIWEPAVFLAGIVFLSVALLYLFLEPLKSLRRKIDSESPHHLNIAKVIQRNIALTSIAMAISIANISFYNVADVRALGDPSNDYLLIISLSLANIDLTANGLAIKCMHNISLPKVFCKSGLNKCTEGGETEDVCDKNAVTLTRNGIGPTAVLPSDFSRDLRNQRNGSTFHGHYSVVLS
jgi:hypothetical protein